MAEWQQGGYEGVFYLGKEGTEEYGGYVVKVDSAPNPEQWFAYEYNTEKRTTVWVGWAPTREAAQTAVKAEFLCEIYRNKEGGHCPYPGVVVRTILYKGERLRTVLCGEHAHVLNNWESFRLEDYRARYGIIPNEPIIGERITPPLDLPPIREAVLKAGTITERNMWIALNRAVKPLAELHYWRGHFARYPLDLNKRPCIDARGQWKQAQEHAQGMYAVYMREIHGQGNDALPDDLLRLLEREAVEYLKTRKADPMTWKYTVEVCEADNHDGECGPWKVSDIKWGADWRDAYRKAEELPHAIVSSAYAGDRGYGKTPHTVFEHREGGDICKGCHKRSQVTGEPLSPESRGPLVKTPQGNEFMCSVCQAAFRRTLEQTAREFGSDPDRWLYVPIIETLDFE